MTDEPTEIPLFAGAIDMIQAETAMKNIAKLVVALQRALVEEGFGPRDALTLCNTWLSSTVTPQGRKQ